LLIHGCLKHHTYYCLSKPPDGKRIELNRRGVESGLNSPKESSGGTGINRALSPTTGDTDYARSDNRMFVLALQAFCNQRGYERTSGIDGCVVFSPAGNRRTVGRWKRKEANRDCSRMGALERNSDDLSGVVAIIERELRSHAHHCWPVSNDYLCHLRDRSGLKWRSV